MEYNHKWGYSTLFHVRENIEQTSDIISNYIISYKPAPRKGDHRKPLSWSNSVVAISGIDSRTLYDQRYNSSTGVWFDKRTEINSHNTDWDVNILSPYVARSGDTLVPTWTDFSNVTLRALNDLSQQVIDIAVIMGEGRETANYLASKLVTTARVLLDFKHLRFSRALKRLGVTRDVIRKPGQTASGLWLEYHYAVLPMLSDVHSLLKISKGTVDFHRIGIGFAREQLQDRSESTKETSLYSKTSTISVKRINTVKITGVVSNPELIAQKNLTSINPASVAWELVPFSFVVDWFLPFGSYLSALTATAGLTDGSFYRSTYVIGTGSGVSSYNKQLTNRGSITHRYAVRAYERKAFDGFPFVGLPSVRNGFQNESNIATAAALIRQLTKR